MLTEIKQLEDRIIVLKKELSEADRARKEKIIEYFCNETGISIGTIVKVNGLDYIVTEMEVIYSDRHISIHGSPRKKDGSFGTARRYLGSENIIHSASWKERKVA